MTQDERWQSNYEEVVKFLKKNDRDLSKYNLEDRRLYTWLKHQRKVMNAGGMNPNRVERFNKLLELCEQYKRTNINEEDISIYWICSNDFVFLL